MRLTVFLATAAASALCAGSLMAQTADPSQSTIPPTNDPTTRTDDQCGAHKGPKPCGAQVVEVPVGPADTYIEPAPEPMDDGAASTTTTTQYSSAAVSPEVRTTLVTNGPVPDTPENRARFGGPDSNGGRRTAPVGND
jgi:hypothetical protein